MGNERITCVKTCRNGGSCFTTMKEPRNPFPTSLLKKPRLQPSIVAWDPLAMDRPDMVARIVNSLELPAKFSLRYMEPDGQRLLVFKYKTRRDACRAVCALSERHPHLAVYTLEKLVRTLHAIEEAKLKTQVEVLCHGSKIGGLRYLHEIAEEHNMRVLFDKIAGRSVIEFKTFSKAFKFVFTIDDCKPIGAPQSVDGRPEKSHLRMAMRLGVEHKDAFKDLSEIIRADYYIRQTMVLASLDHHTKRQREEEEGESSSKRQCTE